MAAAQQQTPEPLRNGSRRRLRVHCLVARCCDVFPLQLQVPAICSPPPIKITAPHRRQECEAPLRKWTKLQAAVRNATLARWHLALRIAWSTALVSSYWLVHVCSASALLSLQPTHGLLCSFKPNAGHTMPRAPRGPWQAASAASSATQHEIASAWQSTHGLLRSFTPQRRAYQA